MVKLVTGPESDKIVRGENPPSGKGAQFLDALSAKRPKLLSAEDKMPQLLDLWDKGLPPGRASMSCTPSCRGR